MRHALAAVTAAIFLSGCVAGPDYGGPPSMAAAAAFARASNEAETRDPPVDTWWSLLGDPVLDQLEAQALEGNLGVEAARARIAQARASVRQQQANRLPTIAGQATAVQANVPGLGLGSGSPSTGPTQGQDDHLSIYNLGLNANWELEFAGGQSRRVQLAKAQVGAALASVDDAKVQLTAEVARAYVSLREAQQRLLLAHEERDLQQQTLALTYQRYTAGVLPLFPVGAANADLERLKSKIAEAGADIAIFKDALSVLTGAAPGRLDGLLSTMASVPLPPANVPIGDPAALIARRPDIRADERRLAASTSRVGVVEAARFPRLSFMGIMGVGGTGPQDVLDLGNVSAIALPRLQWSLLDFGRNGAAVDEAEGALSEADARYRETVLKALQDAEQALARFGQQRVNVAALSQIYRQAETAAELSRQRFDAGAIGLSDLNQALRQRAEARANLNRAIAAMTISWVAIQKSLGLGWRSDAAAPNEGRRFE